MVNSVQSSKFQDRRLEFDGTMCSNNHPNGSEKLASSHFTYITHYGQRKRENSRKLQLSTNLPPNTASLVCDILMHPDATDPYTQIKNQLINRSGESFQQEARKLFSEEELGSRKPSELLRNMKRRAATLNVDDKLMMELFLQRLPSSVQTILAAVSDLTLNKAADTAARILEVSPSPIETFAVSNKKEHFLPRILPQLTCMGRKH
ncbi:retrovirus-related Pol polyprotein from transposon gypsy [Trichonephila clavipes]|nr:retrovirus-related Pol polyprotein from transposon gypsy [Trichonephila clavipes]